MNFRRMQDEWAAMLSEKTYRLRSHHLQEFHDADPVDFISLIALTRTRISFEDTLPTMIGDCAIFRFAHRWQRGKLIDVVQIKVDKTKKGYQIPWISHFEFVDIGRIPKGYHVEAFAIASVGTGDIRGGKWQQRWLTERRETQFIPEVEARIPRLKTYPAFGMIKQCLWTMRDPRLAPLLKDLSSRSVQRRTAALSMISDMEWNVEDLPKLPARLATEGVRAFFDMLSPSADPRNTMPMIKAKWLLQRIAVGAPQLVAVFASQSKNENIAIRIAALRGLLAVSRASRSSIPPLIELLEDPDISVHKELLNGIHQIFSHAECNWSDDRSEASIVQQQEVVFEVGCRMLASLASETDPDLVTALRLALHRIRGWSPKLRRRIKKQCGDLQGVLWPES